MQIVKQELWTPIKLPAMIVVTTNGVINGRSELVMGRGAAKQATKRIPDIAKECGAAIWNTGCESPALYHWLVVRSPFRDGKAGFGLFQVKLIWSDMASLDIIRVSAQKLAAYANEHPNLNIRMNYPGIGNGKLERKAVEPLLHVLPNSVTICIR